MCDLYIVAVHVKLQVTNSGTCAPGLQDSEAAVEGAHDGSRDGGGSLGAAPAHPQSSTMKRARGMSCQERTQRIEVVSNSLPSSRLLVTPSSRRLHALDNGSYDSL